MGVQTQPHVESRQTHKQVISPPNLTELGTTKPVGQEVAELGKPIGQEVTELETRKLVGQEATEQEVTTPFRQEVTEHEERDSELENNAAAHDPEVQKSLNMVGQQATWEKVPTFSDKNDEKRHLVIKSDRDDSKHIKAAADNFHDDMEKNDGPGNHQVETTAAEGGGEEDEEDNDNESVEMTAEEKEEMRNAVRDGDIDRLEDCLDRPGADIRMIYFKENLLMTAIRADQVHMAEFLLDNGVDHNFSTILLNMKDTRGASPSHTLECYKYSCRQMAYDKGLLEIVEIIDILNGRLFPGVTPRSRFPRYQRPPKSSSSGDDDSDDDSDGELSSTSADQSNAARPGAKNRSRTSSKDGADAFPGEGAKDSEGQRGR
ncbi:hypothetical protein C0Q70_15451 [Pomacea canaliculata]|uniref:Uncharacterized protein n=2 Tax=Pomacea canaliculata TaxID=400727 RepID=A0A2T7NUX0_POMCA|nr:hypothetical protein C0Q70_15451 [Pomacea canaliculata]